MQGSSQRAGGSKAAQGDRVVTQHRINAADSSALPGIADGEVALVITSPPYPMISIWDREFGPPGSPIAAALDGGDGRAAFDLMHAELDRTWSELARVVMPGGFVCVNVGDATRSIGGSFQLFPNHARIVERFLTLGFSCLPAIIWRKETNAPNKFMGSGMLPAGAYVTLEHEHVLIFRKGGARKFTSADERLHRRQSAVFWEERNAWFSDLWTFKGIRQQVVAPYGPPPAAANGAGDEQEQPPPRSGSFPFELAFRLMHMYSLREELVLDPFLGTGTVSLAAAAGCRHSVGVERVPERALAAVRGLLANAVAAGAREQQRLTEHAAFVAGGTRTLRHHNHHLDQPVMTRQETDLRIDLPADVATQEGDVIAVGYQPVMAAGAAADEAATVATGGAD